MSANKGSEEDKSLEAPNDKEDTFDQENETAAKEVSKEGEIVKEDTIEKETYEENTGDKVGGGTETLENDESPEEKGKSKSQKVESEIQRSDSDIEEMLASVVGEKVEKPQKESLKEPESVSVEINEQKMEIDKKEKLMDEKEEIPQSTDNNLDVELEYFSSELIKKNDESRDEGNAMEVDDFSLDVPENECKIEAEDITIEEVYDKGSELEYCTDDPPSQEVVEDPLKIQTLSSMPSKDVSTLRMQMSKEDIEKMIADGKLEKVSDGYYRVNASSLQDLKFTGNVASFEKANTGGKSPIRGFKPSILKSALTDKSSKPVVSESNIPKRSGPRPCPASKKLKVSKETVVGSKTDTPQASKIVATPISLSKSVQTPLTPVLSAATAVQSSPSYIALMPVNQVPSNSSNAIITLPVQQNIVTNYNPALPTYITIPQGSIPSSTLAAPTQILTEIRKPAPVQNVVAKITNPPVVPEKPINPPGPSERPKIPIYPQNKVMPPPVVSEKISKPSVIPEKLPKPSVVVPEETSKPQAAPEKLQKPTISSPEKVSVPTEKISDPSVLESITSTTQTLRASTQKAKTSAEETISVLSTPLSSSSMGKNRPYFETTKVKRPYKFAKPLRKKKKTRKLKDYVSDLNTSEEEEEEKDKISEKSKSGNELAAMFFKEIGELPQSNKSLLDKLHKAIFAEASLDSEESEESEESDIGEIISDIKSGRTKYQAINCPGPGQYEAYVGPANNSKLSIVRCKEVKPIKNFLYEVYKVRVTSAAREANTNILIPVPDGYKFQLPTKGKEELVEFSHVPHEDPESTTHVSPVFLEKLAETELKLRKYKEEIKTLRRRYLELLQEYGNRPQFSTISDLVGASAKFLTEDQLIFFLMQLKSGAHNMQGIRYSVREKVLALSIYQKSPEVYKWLRKVFHLPSKRVLDQWLEDVGAQDPQLLKKLMYRIYTTYNYKPEV